MASSIGSEISSAKGLYLALSDSAASAKPSPTRLAV